jgi:hypothetical protein
MPGGYVGWGLVANQANTETGGATQTVADVSTAKDVGLGVGGQGVVNTYSGAPPIPPTILGYLLLETGVLDYLLQEDGFRIQLE